MVKDNTVKLARNLRKNSTKAERLLWSHLRDRQISGVKFRRQFPLDRYILDFYSPQTHLAIELDGSQHNELENDRKDQERTRFLNSKGIRLIRFWNHEIFNDLDAVILTIQDNLTPSLSTLERE